MNRSRFVAAGLVLGASVWMLGAPGCNDAAQTPAVANSQRVEADVRALLDRWIRAFETRDLDGVRSVLATDNRFIWLEDGESRYQSPDAVVAALASFPPALSFSHALSASRVVPISDRAAWVHLAAKTEIRQGDQVVSAFPSVVLMLVERDQETWRIVAAHSSTPKAQGRPPG